MTRQSYPDTLFRRLIALLLILSLFSFTFAIPQNITIDDEHGDEQTGLLPGYSPVGAWSQGADCTRCLIQPDPSQALRSTWHDATHTPGDAEPRVVSLQFNGTAIYTYFIVPNTVPFATTLTNTTFELDGEFVFRFVHIPTSDGSLQYNVPGYVNSTVPPGRHQLNIIGTGETNASVILFDYAVYTFDNDPSSSTPTSTSTPTTTSGSAASAAPETKSSRVPVIVGSVLGVVALILAVVGFIFCLRRRRQRSLKGVDVITNAVQVEPFMGEIRSASHLAPTEYPPQSLSSVHQSRSYPAAVSSSTLGLSATTTTLQSQDTTASASESAHLIRSDVAYVQPSNPQSRSQPSAQHPSSSRGGVSKSSRQQELQQRMQEVQNTLANLRHQASLRSSSGGSRGHTQNESMSTGRLGDVSDAVSSPLLEQDSSGRSLSGGGNGRGSETEPLWREIAELQAEVERLRSQQDLLHGLDLVNEPPPVYEEDDSDRTRSGGFRFSD